MDIDLEILTPKTREVLKLLVKNNYLSNFVLVGGSALALHIKHRQSEDLDFFTYKKGCFDIQKIKKLLNAKIVNMTEEQVDLLANGVKVTFFDAKWNFLQPKEIKNFNLATLEQIAIMKANVLFLRAKYRDYYDMYFLIKKFGIKKIYELSKDYLDGINFKLFATALIYIDDIEDENIAHLNPTYKLTLKQIRDFFEKELKDYKWH
jgi:predicted nucleotidyltransferase component of viral defense system